MVNHGVSRACRTCRLRRKKCDETRPCCQRCLKAGRSCRGYQSETDLYFRPHGIAKTGLQNQALLGPLGPPTISFPWLSDSLSEVMIDAQIEVNAQAAFMQDYCFVPKSRLSHGYLESLEPLLAIARPLSNLTEAAQVVGMASIGRKLGRPALLHKARIIYSKLLGSFQITISRVAMISDNESLMTMILLGLYEIITATHDHPSNHASHSLGIYAILSTKHSLFNLLNWANHFRMFNSTTSQGSLKTMSSSIFDPSLEDLLTRSWPLLQRVDNLLSSTLALAEELDQVLEEAKSLNKEFSRWPDAQPEGWSPVTIGPAHNTHIVTAVFPSWSGRIDVYHDLHVAAVWNQYRKARLLILNAIIRCSNRLEKKNSCHEEKADVEELVNSIAASIPFHLFKDPTSLVVETEAGNRSVLTPGRSIGGLLIMHVLSIVSNLPVVSPPMQALMKESLSWFGTYMGIGQATALLNTPPRFPNSAIANGCALIWAGMLFYKFENMEVTSPP